MLIYWWQSSVSPLLIVFNIFGFGFVKWISGEISNLFFSDWSCDLLRKISTFLLTLLTYRVQVKNVIVKNNNLVDLVCFYTNFNIFLPLFLQKSNHTLCSMLTMLFSSTTCTHMLLPFSLIRVSAVHILQLMTDSEYYAMRSHRREREKRIR